MPHYHTRSIRSPLKLSLNENDTEIYLIWRRRTIRDQLSVSVV